MLKSRSGHRLIAALSVIGVGLCVARAIADSYTWTGNTDNVWAEDDNWTRAGCGSPCYEYPDDTGDDATISTSVNIVEDTQEIDDLTISNADVRIGSPTGSGFCETDNVVSIDSVIITGISGAAKLRAGHCQIISTY